MTEQTDMVTPEEMAEMHSVNPKTIYRMLYADRDRATDERELPGAVKIGEGKRGVWSIPRVEAEAWTPRKRGRQPSS